MLYAIRALSPVQASLVGLVFGSVLYAGAYYWIVHLLRQFADLSPAASGAGLLALSVYHGAMIAVVVYLVRRAELRLGLKPIWTLPIAYTALEFVYPQLFPANYGAALYRASALTQIVEVTGVVGLTAFVALVNGAGWEVIDARTSRRPLVARRLLCAGAIALAITVYGVVRLPMIDTQIAAAPKLKVALIQTNMGAREKLERRDDFIARHQEMSRQAVERNPDVALVVWPESAYNRTVARGITNVAHVTGRPPVPVVFGAITFEGAPPNRRFYNSALVAEPSGHVAARFDKVRLVAFSETLPSIATSVAIDKLIAQHIPRADVFAHGATFEHLRAAGTVMLPTICYEATLPGFVRDLWRRAGPAEVLLNLTNDSWFGDSREPTIHLALATFRSIETRRALIRSTNTGISALIDPAGRIYQRTGQWTREALIGEVPLIKLGTSPVYQRIGDVFGWVCVGLVALGWIASATSRRGEA